MQIFWRDDLSIGAVHSNALRRFALQLCEGYGQGKQFVIEIFDPALTKRTV